MVRKLANPLPVLGVRLPVLMLLILLASSCLPKEEIQFRDITNLKFNLSGPRVSGDVLLYNPNRMAMKLKGADIQVLVDGKTVGTLNQEVNTPIPAQSEFTIPVDIRLSMKDMGIFNTIGSFFGGKGIAVGFKGTIRVAVGGITMTVPIDHTEQVKPGR